MYTVHFKSSQLFMWSIDVDVDREQITVFVLIKIYIMIYTLYISNLKTEVKLYRCLTITDLTGVSSSKP